jgi:hypothetical protein
MIFRNFYRSRKNKYLIRKFGSTLAGEKSRKCKNRLPSIFDRGLVNSAAKRPNNQFTPQEARLSRKSAYTALDCFLRIAILTGLSTAPITILPTSDDLQKNIFYRTAQAAVERSPERRGQMTDLSDAVLPHFSAMTPSEISRQIAELNERIRRRNPNRARFDPEAIVARIEAGEQLFFALDEADLKALFGSTAPFRDQDVVFVTLRKQADGPLVEVVSTTLVNKKVHP